MFKDDRMMSMLTFVVIMIALGTMAQRSDILSRLMGEAPIPLELRSDEIILLANELTGIDVLANDVGLKSADPERLVVVEQPACGRVFVRDGKAHYLPAERCAGPQNFRYAISGRGDQTGEVTAVVRLKDPAQSQVTAEAQRDIATPAPGAAQPALLRSTTNPSTLAPRGEAATDLARAPSVPRPQTGTVADLASPSSGSATSGGAGLVVGSAGQTPSIIVPGQGLGSGPPPQVADAPRAPAPQPPDAAPETATAVPDGAISAGSDSSSAAGSVPQQTGALDLQVQSQSGGPGAAVPQIAPAAIDVNGTASPTADQPVAALGALLARNEQLQPSPGTIPQPPTLTQPAEGPQPVAGSQPQVADTVAALAPSTLQRPTTGAATQTEPAAAAPPAEPCHVPPALTISSMSGGHTEIAIDAPCDSGRVARLSYDTLEFGLLIGTNGKGSITVPGFQRFSNAELRLPSGDGLAFDLPFTDMERIERVAVVWKSPVQLELHAFEFGALSGSPGHVRPDQPRSFDEVRRRGGGYLVAYQPVGATGQSISVYSYWRRPGGNTGVIKLAVDFASRSTASPGTCGTGPLARPDFRVLRSDGGKLSRPGLRRLAPLDCAAIAGAKRLIGDAVDDMVVLKR